MSEKTPDLNALRTKVLAQKESAETENRDAVNTLEKFEALPMEEQLRRMSEKEYTDLNLFKKKHFGSGIDINKLRTQVKDSPDESGD